MPRTLTAAELRDCYNRAAELRDSQPIYERRVFDELIAHGDFGGARAVFELGCGSGRFAARLLAGPLPDTARYHGTDVSERMVRLARDRLRDWSGRATVNLTDGSLHLWSPDGAFDRLVANYVVDLLADHQIRQLAIEAKRILAPGGRLCIATLTDGIEPMSRLVSWSWKAAFALAPSAVRGRRPIQLRRFFPAADWNVLHRRVVVAWGVASELLIASPKE